jgi:hypothetical protein
MPDDIEPTPDRSLSEIAGEIRGDWAKVNFGAVPYLDAMDQLSSIDDNFYMDSADSVVNYFLSNASGWRGETAKRVKSELKGMVQRRQAGPPQGGYPEQGTHGQEWDSPEPSEEPASEEPTDDLLESYYRSVYGKHLKPSRRSAFDAGHLNPGHTQTPPPTDPE